MDPDALATIVRDRRRALGLSQVGLADLAGVSERFLRSVESGKGSVQFDKLTALLTTLGLRLSFELRATT